jgi:Ulp1 family protease
MSQHHWALAVVFMEEKRIQLYDSNASSSIRYSQNMRQYYLDTIFRYLQDDHMDKKASTLPNADSWQLIPFSDDTPQQTNGKKQKS